MFIDSLHSEAADGSRIQVADDQHRSEKTPTSGLHKR